MKQKAKKEANRYASTVTVLQKVGVSTAQIAISPLLFTLRLLVVRNKLFRNSKHLDLGNNGKDATYVLYANHQSALDPLIICASLPLKTIRQLLPFRFFVENSYFKGTLKVFLHAMGGFPAHHHPTKPYGLDKAKSLLTSNQTIVIFPPGTRTRERTAKPGISALAIEPHTYLIPIHIDWQHRWHCRVSVGRPLKGGITYSPEQLMELVYSLPLDRSQEI